MSVGAAFPVIIPSPASVSQVSHFLWIICERMRTRFIDNQSESMLGACFGKTSSISSHCKVLTLELKRTQLTSW